MNEPRLDDVDCRACCSRDVRRLAVLKRQGIPHGREGHNLSYEHVVVTACRACAVGQVEVYLHDCFPMDELHDRYGWYVLSPADTSRLEEVLRGCPAPLAPECACPVHVALRSSAGKLEARPYEVRQASLAVTRGVPELTRKPS